jgi:hypothetical protein
LPEFDEPECEDPEELEIPWLALPEFEELPELCEPEDLLEPFWSLGTLSV